MKKYLILLSLIYINLSAQPGKTTLIRDQITGDDWIHSMGFIWATHGVLTDTVHADSVWIKDFGWMSNFAFNNLKRNSVFANTNLHKDGDTVKMDSIIKFRNNFKITNDKDTMFYQIFSQDTVGDEKETLQKSMALNTWQIDKDTNYVNAYYFLNTDTSRYLSEAQWTFGVGVYKDFHLLNTSYMAMNTTLDRQSSDTTSFYILGHTKYIYNNHNIIGYIQSFLELNDDATILSYYWANKRYHRQIKNEIILNQSGSYLFNDSLSTVNDSTRLLNKHKISNLIKDSLNNFHSNIVTTGNIRGSNDLTYLVRHGVASADSVNYNVGGTRYIYYKLAPGISSHEADSCVIAGDSIKILTPGDYEIWCWLGASTTNANDKIRVKLYVNNSASLTSLGRWIIKSDGTTTDIPTSAWMWYKTPVTRNSWISIRAANLTGSRVIYVTDMKLYIKKMPE